MYWLPGTISEIFHELVPPEIKNENLKKSGELIIVCELAKYPPKRRGKSKHL